ncbi:MAG TPA: sigma 54-interacting transcriptional regulator [Polyangiaceae bacterium]|nr:sigma 54-interacting transcriptional regulator [Polyangiaceae bacterium]
MAAESRTLELDSLAPSSDTSTSWELLVQERHQRRVFRLPESGIVTIGRGAHCDLRLDDDSVSRQHARLHLPSLEIEDLGSRNGSWVLDLGPHFSLGAAAERRPTDEEALTPHVRSHFEPGAVLKFGGVACQLQRGVPSIHTLPVPAAAVDDSPVFEDPEMVQLYALAERVAGTGLPLLILGETGVGKDVLAARVHQISPRQKGPFVRVNCGALSESLLESELFGHMRGAFTGANDAKAGLFEVGNGGTVFLDEIGELPLRTQVKLLHVLETGQVTRVGSTKVQRIDVRFVSATNRELARDVQAGTFRKDLYFRINTLCLKINPLRERRDDILPLVRHFLQRACRSMGMAVPPISDEARQHLEHYGWPGNVRELKNSVERARLLCGNGPLLPEHFPTERDLLNPAPDIVDTWTDEDPPTKVRRRSSLESGPVEKIPSNHAALIEALNACGGNQTRAAEMLGISRRTLVNRLNEFNLPRPRKGRS